jgi:hypothetical protein
MENRCVLNLRIYVQHAQRENIALQKAQFASGVLKADIATSMAPSPDAADCAQMEHIQMGGSLSIA